MKEEWLNNQVSETVVTSCNIDDITNVDVDPLLPLYCILVSHRRKCCNYCIVCIRGSIIICVYSALLHSTPSCSEIC